MISSSRRGHRWAAAAFLAVPVLSTQLAAQSEAGLRKAQAAAHGSDCEKARPFYWEVGGSVGDPIASGRVGKEAPRRADALPIASASKWVLGAYILERFGGLPADPRFIELARMRAGYDKFNPMLCVTSKSVSDCMEVGANAHVSKELVGSFNYNGGHSQYMAAEKTLLGLGTHDSEALTVEFREKLRLGPSFRYRWPVLGMGIEANAADYATFLQRLIPNSSGGYAMRNYLTDGAETLPCSPVSPRCSPMGNTKWRYAFHYWAETNEAQGTLPGGAAVLPGDGAYSSPGIFGFYPWIRRGPRGDWFYGIISRMGGPEGYKASVVCGQAIRSAFFSS
jgi:hypothetical protein